MVGHLVHVLQVSHDEDLSKAAAEGGQSIQYRLPTLRVQAPEDLVEDEQRKRLARPLLDELAQGEPQRERHHVLFATGQHRLADPVFYQRHAEISVELQRGVAAVGQERKALARVSGQFGTDARVQLQAKGAHLLRARIVKILALAQGANLFGDRLLVGQAFLHVLKVSLGKVSGRPRRAYLSLEASPLLLKLLVPLDHVPGRGGIAQAQFGQTSAQRIEPGGRLTHPLQCVLGFLAAPGGSPVGLGQRDPPFRARSKCHYVGFEALSVGNGLRRGRVIEAFLRVGDSPSNRFAGGESVGEVSDLLS